MLKTLLNRIVWMGIGAVLGVAGMSDVASTLAAGTPEVLQTVVIDPLMTLWNGAELSFDN